MILLTIKQSTTNCRGKEKGWKRGVVVHRRKSVVQRPGKLYDPAITKFRPQTYNGKQKVGQNEKSEEKALRRVAGDGLYDDGSAAHTLRLIELRT